MDGTLLETIIGAIIEILNRHRANAGEPPLTDAQAAALKEEALQDGDVKMAAWFAARGLPVPQ